MCIFPSDGISRIRFTGLDDKIHSQPMRRLPEDLFACDLFLL